MPNIDSKISKEIIAVTVNYKTPNLVIELLKSLEQYADKCYLYVVDNCSGDDSVELINNFIIENSVDWAAVIPADKNGGFSYGNNLVFRDLLSDMVNFEYVWMLNPDTKVLPGALDQFLDEMKAVNADVGGTRLVDEDGSSQVSAFNFPGLMSEFLSTARLGVLDRLFRNKLVHGKQSTEAEQCDWLAGASVLIKRSAFKKVGLMDETYFLYFEEVDWFKQYKKNICSVWYLPKGAVFHAVGASTGISDLRKNAPRRPRYWFQSRRYYFLKNHGYLTLQVANLLHVAGYVFWWLRKTITFEQSAIRKEPEKYLYDFIRYSFKG